METNNRHYDICCIGHTTMDRVITATDTVHMPGGTSIYFSNAMAALDVRYALITSLAPDDESALEGLRKRGVDITLYPSAHTLFFENIYGNNSDERKQRVLAVADPFTPEQLAKVKASVYHLGTLMAGDIPAAAIKALAAKGKISLDVQGYLRKVENENVIPVDWDEKNASLPLLHFLKANEEEMFVLTKTYDIEEGAKQLLQFGVREVIITCGSKGSFVYTNEGLFSIPAFPPAVLKDATGCGDTYMAGYLYKRCKGAGIQEAGEFGAAMATLKIGVSGPFCGTGDDMQQLLQTTPKR